MGRLQTHLALEVSEVGAAQVVHGDELLRIVVLHQVLVQELGAEDAVVQLQASQHIRFDHFSQALARICSRSSSECLNHVRSSMLGRSYIEPASSPGHRR